MTTLTSSDIAELEHLANEVETARPHAARVLRRLLKTSVRPAKEQMLTTGAAAIELGVSGQTIRNWVDAGWLPARRLHRLGRRMIPESALRGVKAFDAVALRSKKQLSEDDAVELVRQHRRARR